MTRMWKAWLCKCTVPRPRWDSSTVVDMGLITSVMERAFAVAQDFFSQPVSIRETVAVNTEQRGWMATGMSTLQGAETHDLKEVFFWGAEIAADDEDVIAGKPLVAVNQWPDAVYPRLRDDLTPYYDTVCAVARQVMSALARSLDRPADFFNKAYENHWRGDNWSNICLQQHPTRPKNGSVLPLTRILVC